MAKKPAWSMLSDEAVDKDGRVKGYAKDTPIFAGLKPEYQRASVDLIRWAANPKVNSG